MDFQDDYYKAVGDQKNAIYWYQKALGVNDIKETRAKLNELLNEKNKLTMTIEITTDIIINATPEKVWSIFSDFKNYPAWNPFIKSIGGDVKLGNTITARIQAPESKEMIFKPKVLTYIDNSELSWLGHLLFPGLFDGKHRFALTLNDNGTTTFTQSEKFSGILIPLFKKQLNINTKQGFEHMNAILKELAELK